MTLYYLGIGSNDQAEKSCREMIQALRKRFGFLYISSVVRSKAVGIEAADYLNGIVCLQSGLGFDELRLWCKSLENDLGRVRGGVHCRADLDILLSVDHLEQVNTAQVTEHFYRLLLEQLILFQREGTIKRLSDSVALELGEKEIIGLTPAELHSENVACRYA